MTDDTHKPGAIEPIATSAAEGSEHEAEAAGRALAAELAPSREILDADQLASLIAPRARLERVFQRFNAYFFTIDGVLLGRKVQGALFAGECALVFALGEAAAQELANRGLRETVKLLHEEYESRDSRLSPMEQGMGHDAAGRRGRLSAPGRELQGNPKLKALLAHVIGGLPWKY